MNTLRRYDIDWVRVIAIGLLLVYHTAIAFQSWGIMIGFITTPKPWEALWLPMTMLNIWRIPLLFFVSGMGVFFALQNRNWLELLKERSLRILVPYMFGIFVIVPVSTALWQHYNGFGISYNANPGHLWFLGNIFAYVVILLPFLYYLKRNENGSIATVIQSIFSNPLGLLLVIGAFILEVVVIKPYPYELYAMTWHGFALGFLAFLFGFCFVMSGDRFWSMMTQWRWLFLIAACGLYIFRLTQPQMRVPQFLIPVESNLWIFSVLAFAYRFLNRPGRALRYLSQAAYPVYILHMIFLSLASLAIFKFDVVAPLQFVLVLALTFAGCFIGYEIIRRTKYIRPLFGLSFYVKSGLPSAEVKSKTQTRRAQK